MKKLSFIVMAIGLGLGSVAFADDDPSHGAKVCDLKQCNCTDAGLCFCPTEACK